ncbi:MMPL family transporter [Nocardioides speluncae]|uniref:MMPL family transporter n=1 Tax=Nocardioides speluncae TaxID=2670337 RepID=UPI000D69BDAD|nr:MMPL family transporter [Nocardioides speluncae]
MSTRSILAAIPMRTARWSAIHPWKAILAWLAFVLIAAGLAVAVPSNQVDDEDYRLGESGRADAMVHEAGLDEPDAENVLIASADGELDQAAAESAAAAITDGMKKVDGVTAVAEPQWSPDKSALLISIQLAKDHEETKELLAVTKDVQGEYDGLTIKQAGDLTLDEAINDQVAEDLHSAEIISLPITLLLMLLAFGALIAAGIPVLLAATSVAATMGLLAPLSHLVPSEPTVGSMIVLIGMAVGVDYSLFYLKREREEREAGRSTLDAVEIAAATSGHSILVSGGAVIASMAGLYLLTDVTFNSLATGAIMVVAVAVLGSITVLPALLAKLGRWVDRPRLPLLWRVNRRIGRGGIAGRVLAPVVRRPGVALLLSSIVMVLLAVPALGMKTHSGNLETLPDSIPEVQTYATISEKFPSEGTSLDVVARGDQDEVKAALESLNAEALKSKHFEDLGVEPITTSEDGGTAVLQLAMPYDESDGKVDDAIEELRDDLVPAAFAGVGGEHAVGGGAVESYDWVKKEQEKLPLVIGFVLLLTLLMMAVSFKSIPVALVSTVLNLGSVGVAFGILTLVFQHGWFAGQLDFTSPGFVIDWIPLFVMVVLVGLSMDYHVFVLSRVREHLGRGLPAKLAVEQGVKDTAGVVTSAAAVMVSVFAIFATLSMMEMKMMGVGLSAAILIDATLIRLVMLPAILVLMGDKAWWPSRPKRPRGTHVSEPTPEYELV